LRAYNVSGSKWITLGRRAVLGRTALGLAPGVEFVDGAGTVTFRVTFRSTKRFVHELDKVALQLD
ncbi:MAG: hypothetical protein ACRDKZ_06530, partial [Actinomycetota bacterium]